MKARISRVLMGLFAVLPFPAFAQADVRVADLVGWWSANPVHGGESAQVALQIIEKDGKPEALLSAPALGVYGFSLGALTVSGNSLETKGLSFPLTWNPASQTLTGHLPADVVPIYKVSVEFNRSPPLEKSPPRDWQAPRPSVRWSVETGAPVWAGLERAEDGTLYV